MPLRISMRSWPRGRFLVILRTSITIFVCVGFVSGISSVVIIISAPLSFVCIAVVRSMTCLKHKREADFCYASGGVFLMRLWTGYTEYVKTSLYLSIEYSKNANYNGGSNVEGGGANGRRTGKDTRASKSRDFSHYTTRPGGDGCRKNYAG